MSMKTMIKVMGLALALGPMMALADDAAKTPAAPAATVETKVAPAQPARPKMTEAQRAEMKARREKFIAERKAAMEAKMLEVIKKYVPEEEKAKALMKELEETVLMGRRMPRGHQLPPQKRPAAAKPATK